MDQAGPQMESTDITDNCLSGCERTTTIALHVGQTYICWIPKMHNFDVPHASKTVNHAPTQSEVHEAYYIWWSPPPPLRHILYTPTVICTSQNNTPLLSQINLSCCQAKVVMDQAGPQMESIDIADNRLSGWERTATIALHVGQTYVEYPKCTTLMCHMPKKS